MNAQIGQRRILVAAGAILLLVIAGLIIYARPNSASGTGPLRTDVRSVALSGARTVHVDLNMGNGKLTVGAGAGHLLDGSFTYNVPVWKPQITYAMSGGNGVLSVVQPSSSVKNLHNPRYEWNLTLNNHVPIDLTVEMGAGSTTLNLAGVQVRSLDLTTGAGNGTVTVDGRSLERFNASTGAGALNVNLEGAWKHSLTGSIKSSVGAITIRTPADTGVRVTASNVVGVINSMGFTQENGAWVNGAYGKTSVALNLDVTSNVGAINLVTSR